MVIDMMKSVITYLQRMLIPHRHFLSCIFIMAALDDDDAAAFVLHANIVSGYAE